jgi:type-F conjugative transfer system pilin assembly protein TrbC
MMILILAGVEINRDVEKLSQQWANIAEKPLTKEVQAFIDELNANTHCCHSSTKTFTMDPLMDTEENLTASTIIGNSSSDDAHKAQVKRDNVIVFMSYSVPKAVWQSLWKEAEALKQPIQFVLRGLPGNSFQALAKKVMDYGCPAMIDPPLFERYNITAAPAFLVKEQGVTSKRSSDEQDHNQNQVEGKGQKPRQETVFYGNVSLSYVVERNLKKNTTPEVKPTALQKETGS